MIIDDMTPRQRYAFEHPVDLGNGHLKPKEDPRTVQVLDGKWRSCLRVCRINGTWLWMAHVVRLDSDSPTGIVPYRKSWSPSVAEDAHATLKHILKGVGSINLDAVAFLHAHGLDDALPDPSSQHLWRELTADELKVFQG